MDRRKFLDTGLGCVVTTAGLAGCLGSISDGEQGENDQSESPYVRWVSTDVFRTYGASVKSYEGDLLGRIAGVGDREPLHLEYVPEESLISGYVDDLKLRRMTGTIDDEFGIVDPTDGDGPVEKVHDLPGAIGTREGGRAIEGSFDEDAVADSLVEAGATDEGEYGGYRLYSGSRLFAVSADVLLSGKYDEQYEEPTAPVRALIDAGNGDATSYAESYDAYDDLVSTLEDDPMTVVWFASEDQRPEHPGEAESTGTDPLGLAIHADPGRDRTTVGIAFRFANEADADEEWGESAADHSTVDIDGPLVTIDETYTREGS